MEAEIKAPHTDISTTAATTSRHYFYRKATQPDLNNTVFINVAESSDDFESRVTDFIQKDALQKTLVRLRQGATVDLARRKADRKARKERERNEDPKQQQHRYKEEPQQRTDGRLFEKLNTLTPTEQNQWLANIHDDAMLMNPHQWLKLASLFNVNSKASRQQTLIGINSHSDVLKDRNIDDPDNSSVSMENYMELRDVQNRNYARDAQVVTEGVKFIKQNRIKEAMDYYKRALDMDPKYADGWFHVAEGLVQQRNLKEAAAQLEKALKLDPDHEGAKALLASIRYTTQTKKAEKGDEWDLVDENGNGLSSSAAKLDKSKGGRDDDEEEKSSKKKKKSSSSSSNYRSHRSSRRSSRSPVSRDSRHRSKESRHHRDDSKRRERKLSPDSKRHRRSSPDSKRHRRSNRSRSKESERHSRHDDRRSQNRRDRSPSESRRHSRRYSRDRESKHKDDKRRHRSRSPSRHHSKRKRSDDDDGDDDKSQKDR